MSMLLRRGNLTSLLANQWLIRSSTALTSTTRASASTSSPASATGAKGENYFERQERLKRPMSPYIMYKPQMTSVLSITHRLTGAGLATLVYTWGVSSLFSSSTNFAQTLQSIQAAVPHSLLFSFKTLVATAFVYHAVNGIRHLAWDLGYGFNLKELYTSGYIVIAITLLAGLGIFTMS